MKEKAEPKKKEEEGTQEVGALRRFGRSFKAGWMKFVTGLAWFNTRLILSLIYFLVIAPINLLTRLVRADLLGRRIGDDPSFWLDPEGVTTDLEEGKRQF